MKLLKEDISVTGLSIMTTNKNNQAMTDIGKLWKEFSEHHFFSKFVESGSEIYSVYHQYESDETGKYRVTIGCRNIAPNDIKEEFSNVKIEAGTYKEYKVKTISPENIGKAWQFIWNDKTLKRAFSTDFELYEKNQMTINIKINC